MTTPLFKRPWKKIIPLLAGAALTASPTALADVGATYGFGPRSAALAGNRVAWGFNGYAAYNNPSGMTLATKDARSPAKRLSFSYGFIQMYPSFDPIGNVVIQNAYVADSQISGEVDTHYRNTSGQAVGASYGFGPEAMDLTVGAAIFLPIDPIATIDTGETFIPEYFLYRARTQRPQLEFAVGAKPIEHLRVGVGLHTAYSLTSNATVFLQSDPNKPSTMRFSASLKPKVAPYAGLLLTPLEDAEDLSLGAVVRFPVTANNNLTLRSSARVFGNLAALDFNFKANSALFYDPLSVELGGSFRHWNYFRFYAQVDYQAWSKFVAPALQIEEPNITSCPDNSCGVAVSGGKNPSFTYRNTWIPRVAEEIQIDPWTFRAGYAYQPGILETPSSDNGNYLDPSKHLFNLGAGFGFPRFLGYDIPGSLDLNLSYHQLVAQRVTKTASDEIGAPGYTAGGKVWGGGLALTLSL